VLSALPGAQRCLDDLRVGHDQGLEARVPVPGDQSPPPVSALEGKHLVRSPRPVERSLPCQQGWLGAGRAYQGHGHPHAAASASTNAEHVLRGVSVPEPDLVNQWLSGPAQFR